MRIAFAPLPVLSFKILGGVHAGVASFQSGYEEIRPIEGGISMVGD